MIDDFLFVGPMKERCHYVMEVFRILDGRIGVPLGPEKTVGPATQLTILGFKLCVPQMLAQIPRDGLKALPTCPWRGKNGLDKLAPCTTRPGGP